MESLAAQKNISLVLQACQHGPVFVYADAHRLRQVLVNIVGNAIKFSRVDDQILVLIRLSGDQVRVEVVDHGPGIPSDDLSLVFTKFYRTANSVNSAVPGTGLGLYIAKMIVDGHGGLIGVQSTVGEGSTVLLYAAACV